MEIYVIATVSNGEAYRFAIQSEFRAPSRPSGDGWKFDPTRGVWMNPVTDDYINYIIGKNEHQWESRRDKRGDPVLDTGVRVVSWRRVNATEWAAFDTDRTYRNALRDDGKNITHDMAAARECHRRLLRAQRSHAMPELDAQFTRALGQGKKAEQAAVEAQRQVLRDLPADPRIDAAQTIAELKAITVP